MRGEQNTGKTDIFLQWNVEKKINKSMGKIKFREAKAN